METGLGARMANCPDGYAWNEKLNVCVQIAQDKWKRASSGSHFWRNAGLTAIGFLFGYLSLWQYGQLAIIAFILLLAYLFFLDTRPVIYPVVGFIAGFVAIYWSQISGIIGFLGRVSQGW